MDKEESLDFWAGLMLAVGIIILIGCLIYSGIATKESTYDDWGENGLSWVIIWLGVAGFIQAMIIKLILNAMAEILRVQKLGADTVMGIAQITCPACAEKIKADAKVCRHCRYVVDKHVWVLKPISTGECQCPKCQRVVSITDEQKANGILDCGHCQRRVSFKLAAA